MLTKTVKTTKQVPVNVLSLKWAKPVSKKLSNLKCTACKKCLGDRRWCLAWAEDEKGKYAMRLCERCGKKSDQALKEKHGKDKT